MVSFQKNRSAQTGKEGSFLQKRKKELQGNGSGIADDFSAPLHQPEEMYQSEQVYSQTMGEGSDKVPVEVPEQTDEGTVPENKKESQKTSEKVGEATESKKKKTIIRKTIAIEEDVFMQLQLLKAYHRLDHQDVIAVAVKEFLKRHTENGRIKEADIKSIMKMVDELKK